MGCGRVGDGGSLLVGDGGPLLVGDGRSLLVGDGGCPVDDGGWLGSASGTSEAPVHPASTDSTDSTAAANAVRQTMLSLVIGRVVSSTGGGVQP